MRSVIVAVALSGVPAAALGFSGGPPAGRVHQCGLQPGCENGCHAPANDTDTIFAVELLAPNPGPFPPSTGWIPDQRYSFLIRVVERAVGRCGHPPRSNPPCVASIPADSCYIGFQMTAIEQVSCASPSQVPAGCFEAGAETTIVCPNPGCTGCPGGAQQYITHNECGFVPQTITATEQERTWGFAWIAPPTGFGPVQFYWAVNSTNANLANTGDTPMFGAVPWDEIEPPCDLLSESDNAPIDKMSLFSDTVSCADPVPATVIVPSFSWSSPQMVGPLGGDTLTVYQVDCGCAGTLFMSKFAGSVLADFK